MTKTELIEKIAAETGLTKKDAGAAFGATVTAITAALADGDKFPASAPSRSVPGRPAPARTPAPVRP